MIWQKASHANPFFYMVDGFRYGFGAEVGISTSKLPPRGPVGLEGLVTYKYKIEGAGHKASDYHGAGAKSFRHTDIEKK